LHGASATHCGSFQGAQPVISEPEARRQAGFIRSCWNSAIKVLCAGSGRDVFEQGAASGWVNRRAPRCTGRITVEARFIRTIRVNEMLLSLMLCVRWQRDDFASVGWRLRTIHRRRLCMPDLPGVPPSIRIIQWPTSWAPMYTGTTAFVCAVFHLGWLNLRRCCSLPGRSSSALLRRALAGKGLTIAGW
jgi:hypothetical protein